MSMRDNLFRELLTNLGKLDRSFLLFAFGLTGSNGTSDDYVPFELVSVKSNGEFELSVQGEKPLSRSSRVEETGRRRSAFSIKISVIAM